MKGKIIMSIFEKNLPDYYHTMYLDGYTPEEIYMAFHRTMAKRLAERQAQADAVDEINITSEVKVK